MPRIGVVIPQKLLDLVDNSAKRSGYTRSEFVRFAIRKIITDKEIRDDSIEKFVQEYPTAANNL